MTVLVTGGAGYIGSTVIRELLSRGYDVISVDNLYRGDYKYLSAFKDNPHLKLTVGDISSAGELDNLLRDVQDLDAVIHLAAVPGLKRCLDDPGRAILTNVYGTFNVLEFARKHDAQKFIFPSSGAVYGVPKFTPISEDHPLNPINLYGVTKLSGEKLVDSYYFNYGLSTVILRFGNIYGVGLFTYWENVIPKFVRQALEGKPLTIYGTGEQGRDFIHILDVVDAIISLLDRKDVKGEKFNLGSGKAVSVNTIANSISEILRGEYGRDVKIIHLPPRKGEPYIKDFYYSTERIRSRLGFKVHWTVKDGIKQIVTFYLERMEGEGL